jgi:hypothetical protein
MFVPFTESVTFWIGSLSVSSLTYPAMRVSVLFPAWTKISGVAVAADAASDMHAAVDINVFNMLFMN